MLQDRRFPDTILPSSYFTSPSERQHTQAEYDAIAKKVREDWQVDVERFQQASLVSNEVLKTPNEYQVSEVFSFNGAVKLSQSELQSLLDGPIKRFITSPSQYLPETKKRFYVQYGHDKLNYGRAESYYSGIVGSEKAQDKLDVLWSTLEDLRTMYPDVQEYVASHKLTLAEWKAALIFYDHLQSTVLQLFHTHSYLKWVLGKDQSSPLSDDKNEILRRAAVQSAEAFYGLLSLHIPKEMYFPSIMPEVVSQLIELLKNDSRPHIQKAVRDFREADHPLYNIIFAEKVAREIHALHKPCTLLGVHYGGAELPSVILHQLQKIGHTEPVEYGSVHFSNYSNKSLGSEHHQTIEAVLDAQVPIEGRDVFIVDDGVLTGHSLVKIGELITSAGGFPHFSVVSFAGSRRVGQMEETGGVAPTFLEARLASAITRVSPFARAMTSEKHYQNIENYSFNLVFARVRRMLTGISRW